MATVADDTNEVKSLADCMQAVVDRLKRGEPCPHDRAYRRGYHQAAYYAYEMIRAGCPVEKIGEWLDQVQLWREGRTEDFCPPKIIRTETANG